MWCFYVYESRTEPLYGRAETDILFNSKRSYLNKEAHVTKYLIKYTKAV
jgi:hypothetical protein